MMHGPTYHQLKSKVSNFFPLGKQAGEQNPKKSTCDGRCDVLEYVEDVELDSMFETDEACRIKTNQTPNADECQDTVGDHGPLSE